MIIYFKWNSASPPIEDDTESDVHNDLINEAESIEALKESQFHISADSLNGIIDSEGTREESDNGLNDKDKKTEFLTIVDESSVSDEDSLDCSVPFKSIDQAGTDSPKDDQNSDKAEAVAMNSKETEDSNDFEVSNYEERYHRVPDEDTTDHSAEIELYLNSAYKTTAEYTELILDKTLYDTTVDIVDSTKISDTGDVSDLKTDNSK